MCACRNNRTKIKYQLCVFKKEGVSTGQHFYVERHNREMKRGSSWGIVWCGPAGTDQMFIIAMHLPISPLLFSALDETFPLGLKWTTCPTHQRRPTCPPTAYSVHSSGGAWRLLQTEGNNGFQLPWCLENKRFFSPSFNQHMIIYYSNLVTNRWKELSKNL